MLYASYKSSLKPVAAAAAKVHYSDHSVLNILPCGVSGGRQTFKGT
jgi:hypothetical protein